jgi:hypothetical protein
MGARADYASDEHLVGLLDQPGHWFVHCVGLKAVSAYSLREALVEGHRIAATAHVIQRIRSATGDTVIEPDQIARLWPLCGEPPE